MALVLGTGCGENHAGVRSELSAEEHRQAAEREKAAANAHAARFSPTAVVPDLKQGPSDPGGAFYSPSVYNPTERHRLQAEKHQRHARKHEAAARALEKFQEEECKNFPPSTRTACPFLGPALSIQDIDRGVAIRMAPGVRVDAIVAHMKCHSAYARAHGYTDATSCPLYLRGLVVKQGTDPAIIELTVPDRAQVAELQRLAHEEVIGPTSREP